jgi:hypothetical protein
MTTRTFFKSLAALAMSPLAVLGRKPVPPPLPPLPPLPIIQSTTKYFYMTLDCDGWMELPKMADDELRKLESDIIAKWNETHEVKIK